MNPRTSSLWTVGPPLPSASALTEDASADVVVLGAGVVGLTTALRLAEAGKRVIVLEARTVASGVTTGTTAHVTTAVDARYATLAKDFGEDGARAVAQSSRAAIEHIGRVVERYRIACDWRRLPSYLFTEHAADRDELAEEHAAARAAGLDVELDAPVRLPFDTAGALCFRDDAELHPHAYVRGLLRAATSHGVRVHEHSRVVDIVDGEPCEVRLEHGPVVRAAEVVCATHVPLNRFFLQTKLVHKQSYVAAFRGIPLPEGLYDDTADPYHYLRAAKIDGEDYLVVGGEDHKTGEEEHTQVAFERLLGWTRARFGTDRPDHHWSAQVIESIDGLPFLGRNSATKHVYVLTGFGGNGFTFGTIGAIVVSDLVLGIENPWASLYAATRVKASAAGAFLRENKDFPAHLVGDRLAPAEVAGPHEIERDQGRTLKHAGKHLAVYRDRKGGLHAVSAVCTHMGCLVHFNEAERTWDCPCHGSRFDVDGEVIDGPATAPLEACPLADAATPEAARGRGR